MQHVVERVASVPDGLSALEFARRAGINRSTLHRIATGSVEPSLATLRELAIVHGLDLTVKVTPLSDPDAATAARHLLDPAFARQAVTPGVQEWIERLERATPSGSDPFLMVGVAGRAASLLHREGTVFLRGDSSALRLSSAGTAAGGSWAVSGKAAIEYGRDVTARGPSVLWVDDVSLAAKALSDTHQVVSSPLNAHVLVAQAQPSLYVDAYSIDAVRYVAPIQMLLDCVGLGGDLAIQAESVAAGWSE